MKTRVVICKHSSSKLSQLTREKLVKVFLHSLLYVDISDETGNTIIHYAGGSFTT